MTTGVVDLLEELAFARHVVDVAAAVALPFFRNDVHHELKGDGSPVTEADVAVEQAVLVMLASDRPGDGVLSEEAGAVRHSGSRRRWLVDPIDGTSWFLVGDTAWGTHIALEVDGEIVVGVITRPALGRAWWAAKGHGAWNSSGRRLQVSTTATLVGARIGGYMRPDSSWQARISMRSRWVATPSPILQLIEGRLDAVLSEGGFGWDHAPGVLLVSEAGGRFTDPDGGGRIDLRGGLYTNGHLHAELQKRPR